MRIATTCTDTERTSRTRRKNSWERLAKKRERERERYWPSVLAKLNGERTTSVCLWYVGERTSPSRNARVFNGPRLSCIKSAIECLVHREFHGHKRPDHGVSHNLRVVAESSLEGTKRTSTGNTDAGSYTEGDERMLDWRERMLVDRKNEKKTDWRFFSNVPKYFPFFSLFSHTRKINKPTAKISIVLGLDLQTGLCHKSATTKRYARPRGGVCEEN